MGLGQSFSYGLPQNNTQSNELKIIIVNISKKKREKKKKSHLNKMTFLHWMRATVPIALLMH